MTATNPLPPDPPPTRFNVDELIRPTIDRRFRRLPRLFGRAFALVWQADRPLLLFAGALQVVTGVGLAIQVFAAEGVLSRILTGGSSFADVLPFLVLLTGIGLIIAVSELVREEQQRLLTEEVGRYATAKVLDVAGSVELISYEHPEFSNRLQRAQINASMRPVQVTNGLLSLLGGVIAVIGVGAALIVIAPVFFILVVLAAIPAALASNVGSRYYYRFAVEQTEPDRRRAYLLEVLSRRETAAEVRSFGVVRFLRARYDRLYEQRIAALRQVTRKRLTLGTTGQVLTSLVTFGALAALVWQVTSGRLTAAEGGAAAGAMVLLASRLRGIFGGTRAMYESALFLEDFTQFVDTYEHLTTDAKAPKPELAPVRFERILVDAVSFTYPSRTSPSLHEVSLEIGAGEVVALVGENGSGKTTLAKLLAGLYPPSAGVIRWDGVDLAGTDPDHVRTSIAVLFQDFVRYHFTAGENIGIGRHERIEDPGAVERAARAAGTHDMILSLDHGYDTKLGPHFLGGTDLSLGQWQRVALARAFFRDCPFVVLDEPTASLDARAERELFEDIRSLLPGRAVLLISHRFANVRSADRIYVLAGGRIVEQGDHDALMALGGSYAELFSLQAATFVDAAGSA
jgi:ATP-binding cassette subfamily B protein